MSTESPQPPALRGSLGWESALRKEAKATRAEVPKFSDAEFAFKLIDELNVKNPGDLQTHLNRSLAALDRQLGGELQYLDFRALIHAAFAWWGISSELPSEAHYRAYLEYQKLVGPDSRRMNLNRRTFRHAWAGRRYRLFHSDENGSHQLIRSDHSEGRKSNRKTQMQDALVAFIFALVDDELEKDSGGADHPARFWGLETRTVNRTPHRGGTILAVRGLPPGQFITKKVSRFLESAQLSLNALPPVSGVPTPASYERPVDLEREVARVSLPYLLSVTAPLIEEACFVPPKSLANLGVYLLLFVGVGETLELFTPDVFDRALDDVIAALAAPSKLAILDSGSQRRLKKLANEYVRPGVPAPDLLSSYEKVRSQRVLWQRFSTVVGAPPVVIANLEESVNAFRKTYRQIHELSEMHGQGEDSSYRDMPLQELLQIFHPNL